MKTVKVERKWLLEQVVINQEKHQEVFEKAYVGYCKKLNKLLEEHLAKVKAGKLDRVFISESPPTKHTRDYKRVVAMLMASVDEEIVLDANEFASYVQDDWHWKQEWSTSTSAYL
jgi:hypothetical protein